MGMEQTCGLRVWTYVSGDAAKSCSSGMVGQGGEEKETALGDLGCWRVRSVGQALKLEVGPERRELLHRTVGAASWRR